MSSCNDPQADQLQGVQRRSFTTRG
ncbi:hypothetical protein [Pseudomonas sp. FP597]